MVILIHTLWCLSLLFAPIECLLFSFSVSHEFVCACHIHDALYMSLSLSLYIYIRTVYESGDAASYPSGGLHHTHKSPAGPPDLARTSGTTGGGSSNGHARTLPNTPTTTLHTTSTLCKYSPQRLILGCVCLSLSVLTRSRVFFSFPFSLLLLLLLFELRRRRLFVSSLLSTTTTDRLKCCWNLSKSSLCLAGI